MRKVVYSSDGNIGDVKTLKIFIAIFSIVVFVIFTVAVANVVITHNKLSYYNKTQAKIIDFEIKMEKVEVDDVRKLVEVHYPIVTYTANDKQYTNTLHNSSSSFVSFNKGDILDIAYNPNSPEDIIMLGINQYEILIILGLLKQKVFEEVQVTTVVNKRNINELDELFEFLNNVGIDSWRVINIDPIGRAKNHPELLLDKNDYIYLFDYIKKKRELGLPVGYGCSHYLGLEYEREVRDWYFLCNAGIYTAAIRTNGDIGACLDIEPRENLIYGNIKRDRFKEVWEQEFRNFREDLSVTNETCRNCKEEPFCHGGACHTWDFDNAKPNVCFRGLLF